MKNLNKAVLALAGFWCRVSIVLLSFLLSIVVIASPVVPKIPAVVLSVIIFIASLTVIIINPGITAKRFSAETGV